MVKNPYPIQIKKRTLLSLIYSFVIILLICLIIGIFSFIMAIFIAIVFGIISIIGIVWNLLYLNSIEYSLDNKNLTFKGGVISRFEKVVPYSKIQHIIISESFWQRVLGLSSISVQTAREGRYSSGAYGGQQTAVQIQIRTGPFIPDLNKKDARKLKNYIISIFNTKYKPVAGV